MEIINFTAKVYVIIILFNGIIIYFVIIMVVSSFNFNCI